MRQEQFGVGLNRTSLPVTVFYRSDFAGRNLTIPANGRANLVALKNENASHQFGTITTTKKNLSFALYNASGGGISCGFDGYQTTNGRHEGIDSARGSAPRSMP